ncbi:MAG: UDP-N-acetylmuramoyl-tripeptide--D-alanyl-D-alanine ligase [Planctomycetota bacterium]
MTEFWSPDNLAKLTDGAWLSFPKAAPTGLWHDTRQLQPGNAFLALPGNRVDGHTLLPQAADAGASCAIITDPNPTHATHPTLPLLLVKDAIAALHALAHAYRTLLGEAETSVIAVSGSNGKTTTRHLIHHVLTNAGNLHGSQAPASFNNHLGVPLTLLRAQPTDRFVALELGTNHPGEIDQLAALARPDLSVIPSLGEEHLEAFTDLAGVVREEAAVLRHVRPGGIILTTPDAGQLLAEHYDVQEGVGMTSVNPDHFTLPADFPLPGEHNHSNAALALAVARLFDIPPNTGQHALSTFTSAPHRSHLRRIGPITLLDDCYNANPSSMHQAITTFMNVKRDAQHILVLGDMLELGEDSEKAHQDLGRLTAFYNPVNARPESPKTSALFLIGDAVQATQRVWTAMGLDRFVTRFNELDDQAIEHITHTIQPGDHILLKASRGLRLERLIPAIETRFTPPPPPTR